MNILSGLTNKEVKERYMKRGRGPDNRRITDQSGKRTRTWQVEEMWDLHHEIARRLLLGQKNVDIARDLNISAHQVSNVKNSPVVKEKMEVMRGARDAATVDIGRQIQEIAPKAIDLLRDVVIGENDGKNASMTLRCKTAEKFLDRAGHAPVTKSANLNLHKTFDAQDLEDIKNRAETLGPLNNVIDI